MLFNYRKLSTAIVSACKSEKKTSQTIVLNAISKFFGFRSIQAAEDALSKSNEQLNTQALSQKLAALKKALEIVANSEENDVFDASQFYKDNDLLNPEVTKPSDFSEKTQAAAEILLTAIKDYKDADLSVINIEHGHFENDTNGNDVFRTFMQFNANGRVLELTALTTESRWNNSWEYESEFVDVTIDKEVIDADMNEFNMDDFFEQLSSGSGEVWVPEKLNVKAVEEAKMLLKENQFALALLQ